MKVSVRLVMWIRARSSFPADIVVPSSNTGVESVRQAVAGPSGVSGLMQESVSVEESAPLTPPHGPQPIALIVPSVRGGPTFVQVNVPGPHRMW